MWEFAAFFARNIFSVTDNKMINKLLTIVLGRFTMTWD